MRALVGHETSGRLRRALRARGVEAWSVDILPSEDDSQFHIIADVFDVAERERFDWGMFMPTCTYCAGSAEWAYLDPDFARYPGVGYHQRVKPGTLTGQARRAAREAALKDVRRIMALPYPKAIENPVGIISTRIRKPDQIIQPYQFGEDASKATCLWLDRLPRLRPTRWVEPRMVGGKPRWANQTDTGQNRLSPGPDRWKERSRSYQGIVDAQADQWTAWMAERIAA